MQSKLSSFFFPHQIFLIRLRICFDLGFPGSSVVTNPHANAADAGSLGGEDPLEKGMETHSSFLSWEIT